LVVAQLCFCICVRLACCPWCRSMLNCLLHVCQRLPKQIQPFFSWHNI
jgi:hypothetical protein